MNPSTPPEVIANVSRVVTRVIDRLTTDRSDYPLLVCLATQQALSQHGIKSTVIYGASAWIEVMEDQSVIWTGCWGKNHAFWVSTEFGEVVDLNTSVSFRKKAHDRPHLKPKHSPPMLWSREVPKFYRYQPEGIAEVELEDPRDRKWMELATAEIREKCTPAILGSETQAFPEEPILIPGRKLLDDAQENFKHFDRALGVQGIPKAPF